MDLHLGYVIGSHNQSKMSVNAIINASNLDINKVTFGDIRISKNNGSKSVPIKYNGQNFQMRIPKLQYPMGVSVKETENGTNYTMLASLRGCDSYAKERAPPEAGEVGQMYNFLKDLEEKVIKTAVAQSKSWFGRERKEDVLRDSMKSLVSPSVEKQGSEWVPNGKYPPSFRMKVPVYPNDKGVPTVNMDAVDMANRPISLTPENLESVFPKRMEARFIVNPSIYVSGQGFGVTWRISYAQVSAQARVSAAQLFEPEETEDAPQTAQVPQDTEQEEQVHEEESVFETPPAPAPAPVPATPAPAKVARRRPVGAAM
jgi:hypothetical protein